MCVRFCPVSGFAGHQLGLAPCLCSRSLDEMEAGRAQASRQRSESDFLTEFPGVRRIGLQSLCISIEREHKTKREIQWSLTRRWWPWPKAQSKLYSAGKALKERESYHLVGKRQGQQPEFLNLEIGENQPRVCPPSPQLWWTERRFETKQGSPCCLFRLCISGKLEVFIKCIHLSSYFPKYLKHRTSLTPHQERKTIQGEKISLSS